MERPAETKTQYPGTQTERADLQDERTRTLIVGAGGVGKTLAKHLEAGGRHRIVGFVDDRTPRNDKDDWPLLGTRDATEAVIERYCIEEIFVAYAPTWQESLADSLAVRHPEVQIHVVPSPYEAQMRTSDVDSVGDIALIQLLKKTNRRVEVCKRIFDVTAAALGLTLSAIPMAIVAVLIKLTSAGPVIFAQERVGRFNRPFILYKFRTMKSDAEAKTGPTRSSGKGDDRLTSIGKWLRLFRIDEIPQLWNVLRGEMSIVGPRPERPYFVDQYQASIPAYNKRHQARPGITGLAQVCGGYHTDARDKLRFDLIYISHQSLWMDFSILVRTILVVVFPDR